MIDTTFADDNVQSLTKREYFAAMAMQALIPTIEDSLGQHMEPSEAREFVTNTAIKLSDALIAGLNK